RPHVRRRPPMSDATFEERLAAERRKRQGLQVALAAAVGLIALGGGLFVWWETRQTAVLRAEQQRAGAEMEAARHAQAEQARESVRAALTLATDLRKQYSFRDAAAALEQAERLAGAGNTPDLAASVKDAKADLQLVAAFDAIRMRRSV